jgi:calcineurin-like phosphoesterase family protein
MTSNIWVISDTHFSHSNILRFTDSQGNPVRPGFSSVEHMNECMIDSWNAVVRPGDKVYHLGDVFFGDRSVFQHLWPKLHGSKRLIVGNHDDIPYLSCGGFFKQVYMWRMFTEFGLLLSHVPLHIDSLYRSKSDKPMLNVHGHIHNNPSPPGPYHCVCVEHTNYTPVNIETLAQIAKRT